MERVFGVSEHGLRDSGGVAGVLAEAPNDRHWVQVREAERNNVERSSTFYGFADPQEDLTQGTRTTPPHKRSSAGRGLSHGWNTSRVPETGSGGATPIQLS